MRLQVVNLAEANQRVGLERLEDRVGEPAGGRCRLGGSSGGCRQARDGCGSQTRGGGLDESPASARSPAQTIPR